MLKQEQEQVKKKRKKKKKIFKILSMILPLIDLEKEIKKNAQKIYK